MSLEAKIEALTGAVEKNNALMEKMLASKGGDAAPAAAAKAEKPAKAAAKAKVPSVEDVTVAGKAYASQHGKPAAKALIAKFGGADLASIPEDKRAAFIEATKQEPESEGEDDDDGL